MLAALLSVTVLAPAAFANYPNTADALVTSQVEATVSSAVATDGPLSGVLEALKGVPLSNGGDFEARVSALNSSDLSLGDVVLRLNLTRQPLATRAELADFLADPSSHALAEAAQEPPAPEPEDDDDVATEANAEVGNNASAQSTSATDSSTATVPATTDAEDQDPPDPVGMRISPHADTTFTLSASAAELGLPSRGWGVYGATLTLVSEDAEVLVDSFPLTWGAQAVPQLDLAVLATAHGVPSRVLNVLETSNLPGVAVAVDPTHLTAVQAITAELRDREVFRLPVRTPDLTSIAHSENNNLMPLALSLPAADDIPVISAAPWLAIPGALDARSVALAGELDARAVLALPHTPGFDDLASGPYSPVVRAPGAPILVPDVALSDTVAQFRPGTPAAAAAAVADSALLAGERSGAPALVALDRDWHIGVGAQVTLRALMDAPWVSPTSVESLLSSSAKQVVLTGSVDDGANLPAEDIDRLGLRLDELTLLATIAESPEDALNDWGRELLRGISVDARGNVLARDASLRNAIEQAEVTLDAVRIADSSELNLLTESGDIPVNVVNGLAHAVTVTVNLNSFSSNLQILDSPTVTVPPASDQVVLVPVEAVSNANVFVAANLHNADGEPISDTQPFSVRVRADWGNAATAVFTVVLVLLLIAGLIRTVRRGRKDTRVDPSTPPETMVDEHG